MRAENTKPRGPKWDHSATRKMRPRHFVAVLRIPKGSRGAKDGRAGERKQYRHDARRPARNGRMRHRTQDPSAAPKSGLQAHIANRTRRRSCRQSAIEMSIGFAIDATVHPLTRPECIHWRDRA